MADDQSSNNSGQPAELKGAGMSTSGPGRNENVTGKTPNAGAVGRPTEGGAAAAKAVSSASSEDSKIGQDTGSVSSPSGTESGISGNQQTGSTGKASVPGKTGI